MLSFNWQKSSRSGSQGNCVELRQGERVVQVRDSKLGGASPVFDLDTETFASLLAGLKNR